MKLRAFILIGFILFLCASNGHAIVSMQSLHLDKPTPGWQGGFDFNLSGATGNTKQFRLQSSLLLLHNKDLNTHFLNLKYEYGESFGKQDVNNAYGHLRRIQSISSLWAFELFGQLEKNKFARLNLRSLLGSGARWQILNNKKNTLVSGFGAFYSIEDINKADTDDEGGIHKFVRGNVYLIYKWDIDTNAQIVSTSYFQPRVNDFNDFRLLEDLIFRYALTQKTAIKFSLQVIHDNDPPLNVKKTDASILAGIEFTF